MALTQSTMLPLGTALPAFSLPDVKTGDAVSPESFLDAPGLLVMFICNHCPFVVHYKDALAAFAREYTGRGLAIVAISSNDVTTHPADGPEAMRADAERFDYCFPYLYDESQDVARAFRAACTPEFYLFDGGRRLVYRGQFDDSRPSNGKPVTGADLRRACNALLAGEPVDPIQKASAGCNIKWKPGNQS